MRISCPNCTATYDVPAELAAGRPVVRCVQCAQEWKLGQAPAPAARTPTQPEPEPLLDPIPAEILGLPQTPGPEPAPADMMVMDRATPASEAEEPAPLAAEIASQDLETATMVAEEPVTRAEEPPAAEAPAAPGTPQRPETASARTLVLASIAGNLVAVTGWAVSLGLILALGWFAIQNRTGIMHAWPPSQRLFTWLGLA